MFQVCLYGLDYMVDYMVMMDFVLCDDKCYRYFFYSFSWVVVGKVDLYMFGRIYVYLDLFVKGLQWMK